MPSTAGESWRQDSGNPASNGAVVESICQLRSGWDRRTWVLGPVLSNLFGGANYFCQQAGEDLIGRHHSYQTAYALRMSACLSAWICFLVLPVLLSVIARKRSFLWGLLPLGTLLFWGRLVRPQTRLLSVSTDIGQLWDSERFLLYLLHLPYDWPRPHVFNEALLFLLGCLLLTSGPISLLRWLLKRGERRQTVPVSIPKPGDVWPPPPTA